jgi:hypothetical protein
VPTQKINGANGAMVVEYFMAEHLTPTENGQLTATITWQRHEFIGKVPKPFGDFAIAAGLYSRGSDFTSDLLAPGEAGSSLMRRIWEGGDVGEEYAGAMVWTLIREDGQAVGSAILETLKPEMAEILLSQKRADGRRGQQLAKAKCVGRLTLWLSPYLRKRGLVGELVRTQIAPTIKKKAKIAHKDGAFPFVRCVDATIPILQKHCQVPIPGFISECKNEAELVKTWAWQAGMEMHRYDKWQVPWIAAAPEAKNSLWACPAQALMATGRSATSARRLASTCAKACGKIGASPTILARPLSTLLEMSSGRLSETFAPF